MPEESFRIVLIGKDGGVKLDQAKGISIQEVFDLIDTMPMRQAEIRKKGDQ